MLYAGLEKSTSPESELFRTYQNDNHSPGPWPGRLVPSPHQRRELSNTILGTFSREDKRVWKCIPIPNGLGKKTTLINISISIGDLIWKRMMIPAAPNQGDKIVCWYTGFTLQTFVYPAILDLFITPFVIKRFWYNTLQARSGLDPK